MSLLCGCATNTIMQHAPADVAARSKIRHDDFRKVTTVECMALTFGALDENRYWLEQRKADDGSAVEYVLLFRTMRGYNTGWAFWSEAYDENGQKLAVRKVGSEVGNGGMTFELVAVELTRDYLEAHRAGIKMRIDGQRAQQIVILPANYIEGFLMRVDSENGNKLATQKTE